MRRHGGRQCRRRRRAEQRRPRRLPLIGTVRQYIALAHDFTLESHLARRPLTGDADGAASAGKRGRRAARVAPRAGRTRACAISSCRVARAGQPHRRDRDRDAARREPHAGSRSAAAAAAGRLRHRLTGRAAVAPDRGAAHARRRLRVAQHRRCARGHGRARRGARCRRPIGAISCATSRRSTPSSTAPARRCRSITAACTTPTSAFIAASSRRARDRGCSRCMTR